MGKQYQLRVYRVHAGEMDEWLGEWRSVIVPLRRRLGFEVAGAWVQRAEDRFAWLLAYDGPEGIEAANERYYDSPERAAVDPNPARHLAAQDAWVMEAVELG